MAPGNGMLKSYKVIAPSSIDRSVVVVAFLQEIYDVINLIVAPFHPHHFRPQARLHAQIEIRITRQMPLPVHVVFMAAATNSVVQCFAADELFVDGLCIR